MPRQRQFYQTDLLYVGPTGLNSATGQLQAGAVYGSTGTQLNQTYISELFRIQKCDNGWDKKLKILNEFGQLSQVDLVPIGLYQTLRYHLVTFRQILLMRI